MERFSGIFLSLVFLVCGIEEKSFCATKYEPPLQIVSAEFPPYSYLNEKGQPSGVMAEIIQEVLKEIATDGQHPKIDHVTILHRPWPRAFKIASGRKNVLLFPMGITPEREGVFHWIGPRLSRNIWIFSLKSAKSGKLKPEDLKGKLVGVTRGYSWEKSILALGAIPDESADDRTLIRKIIGNRMSYISMDEQVLEYLLKLMAKDDPEVRQVEFKKVYPLSLGTRSFGFSEHSDPDLISRFEKAYKKLEKKGLIQKILKANSIR